jgi:hypothetical protein
VYALAANAFIPSFFTREGKHAKATKIYPLEVMAKDLIDNTNDFEIGVTFPWIAVEKIPIFDDRKWDRSRINWTGSEIDVEKKS